MLEQSMSGLLNHLREKWRRILSFIGDSEEPHSLSSHFMLILALFFYDLFGF